MGTSTSLSAGIVVPIHKRKALGDKLLASQDVISLGEWHLNPPPPVEWLVEGIWQEHGGGFVMGDPGTGKSWLLMDIAICMATGAPWLGKYPVKPGNTYMVVEEGNIDDVYSCYHRLLKGHGITPAAVDGKIAIDFCHGYDLLRVRDRKDLVNRVLSVGEAMGWKDGIPDLVQMDPFAGVHTGDENKNNEMADLCYHGLNIIRKALDHRIALQIIHHSRKKAQGEGSDRGAVLRGAQALIGWADAIIDVNARGSEISQLSNGKLRGTSWDSFWCRREIQDDSARLFWAEPEDGVAATEDRMQKQILSIVAHAPSIGMRGIREAVRGNNTKIKEQVDWLIQQQALVCTVDEKKAHHFSLPDEGAVPSD